MAFTTSSSLESSNCYDQKHVDPIGVTRRAMGKWMGENGVAPCPICQPECRRNQRALSISTKEGRLLLYCHKSGCNFLGVLAALGMAEGGQSFSVDTAN
ncbi:MAG: hypothetical protein HRU33_22335 [Rhodobacteraceae bacterium]|nr:hypothetical protein [Paracoccaceae bacterium]